MTSIVGQSYDKHLHRSRYFKLGSLIRKTYSFAKPVQDQSRTSGS